jgi:hypothetical protein
LLKPHWRKWRVKNEDVFDHALLACGASGVPFMYTTTWNSFMSLLSSSSIDSLAAAGETVETALACRSSVAHLQSHGAIARSAPTHYVPQRASSRNLQIACGDEGLQQAGEDVVWFLLCVILNGGRGSALWATR